MGRMTAGDRKTVLIAIGGRPSGFAQVNEFIGSVGIAVMGSLRGDDIVSLRTGEQKKMEVGALMTRVVHRVRPDTGIAEVSTLLRVQNIGALPVESDGRLVGMVTDRDIVTRIIGNGVRTGTATANDAMTPKVYYVFDDEDAENVARNMRDLQVRRMPVLDRKKRLVGIVSIGDLACRIPPEVTGDALEGISEELGG